MARAIIVPSCVFLAGVLTSGVAVGANDKPIDARLLNCEPQEDKPKDAFLAGYQGVGYHQVDYSHYMRAHVGFWKDSNQSIGDALTQIDRIYLCQFKNNVMRCPTDATNPLSDDYVLFERGRIENRITEKRVLDRGPGGVIAGVPSRKAAGTELLDLDWQNDADKDIAVFLRVQRKGTSLGKSSLFPLLT